ncbi:hypothetical protein OX284_013795 [Flavobacterium sp. SUN046]|nr:hypothetical protein [Flavobacterium sp. SUN046]MEC4050510.1 hypothetical protein [Flavobacterium sp. SUN046]
MEVVYGLRFEYKTNNGDLGIVIQFRGLFGKVAGVFGGVSSFYGELPF